MLGMTIISLLTDFGTKDGFIGVMKGVIWGIAPEAFISDLTHEIAPQNVAHGAYILGQSYAYFPAGSVHTAVVDPGVGTQRLGLAARIGSQFFVAPDNGLITIPWKNANQAGESIEIVALNRPEFWLKNVSHSFHGRDIFAPVAAYLARGVPLKDLGDPLPEPVLLDLPEPVINETDAQAQVILVDSFGNLITNFTRAMAADRKIAEISVAGEKLKGLVSTFGAAQPEALIAMFDSSDRLSVCVVNGSAAGRLSAAVGTAVTIHWA
jgi:S-adenosylmethionine hydrolase